MTDAPPDHHATPPVRARRRLPTWATTSIERSRRWVRAEWRAGRISTRGLPGGVRLMAVLAVAVALGAAAVIVVLGVGVSLPGGAVDVAGRYVGSPDAQALPHALVAFLLVGIAVAAAALTWSAALPGARLPRWTLAVVALVDGALAGATLASAGPMRVVEDVAGPQAISPVLVVTVIGAVGLLLALGLAMVPGAWLRRDPARFALVAATPPLLVGIAYILIGGVAATVGLDALLESPDFPTTLSAQGTLAPSLRGVAQSAAFLLVPFAIWQAATWARASGGPIGQRVANRVDGAPWMLWLLIVLKLAWLLAGYTGVLPQALGGWSPEWRQSLEDGPLGWGLALALVAVAGWWLGGARGIRISRLGWRRAALGVAIGFASWSLLMGGLGLLTYVADALPGAAAMPPMERCGSEWSTGSPAYAVLCLQSALVGWLPVAWVGTVLAALIVGSWMLVRGRGVSIGAFLVVVAVWALPRAANGARALLFGDAPSGADAPGTIELATLDAAVTVLVAALAAGWWLGRGPRAEPWTLGLVLVVTTLLTRSSTLILPGWSVPFFYVALVFPLLYELGLDSEDLNRPSRHRPARVLHALGLRAGALTLLLVGLGFGFATSEDGDAAVAYAIFAPPFAAWFVASIISARRRRLRSSGPMPVGRPSLRPVLLGAGGGIAVAAALLMAGTFASPLVRGAIESPRGGAGASEPPSEQWRFLEFFARERAVRDELIAINGRLDSATAVDDYHRVGRDLATKAAAELTWMAAHPPGSCYEEAWEARRLEMERTEHMGQALAAPIEDEAAWLAALEATMLAWADASDLLADALASAPASCGIGMDLERAIS